MWHVRPLYIQNQTTSRKRTISSNGARLAIRGHASNVLLRRQSLAFRRSRIIRQGRYQGFIPSVRQFGPFAHHALPLIQAALEKVHIQFSLNYFTFIFSHEHILERHKSHNDLGHTLGPRAIEHDGHGHD